jgi:hypothetical protein
MSVVSGQKRCLVDDFSNFLPNRLITDFAGQHVDCAPGPWQTRIGLPARSKLMVEPALKFVII